ncbi:MAG: SRPBCC domain-containing protein [Saprospiraceae bacterium]|nr:SRPBCC domain-containing protein [Saprospiraceae bacterium]
MEHKTKVHAENGKQELFITRDFDLPVELLFKAYTEPHLVEQWMGTKVVQLEPKNQGAYRFETTDPKGNIHRFNGVIHEFALNQKITRTFEMENTPFPVQLEFLEFEALSAETSRLVMQIIYKSAAHRDQMLQMPFEFGINMAHNRLQQIAKAQ